MHDAQDSIVRDSTYKPSYIADNDPLSHEDKRVDQQQLQPGAVNTRHLGNVVGSIPNGFTPGTGTRLNVASLASATTYTFVFTASATNNPILLAVPDVAVYIGTVTSANQWPNTTYTPVTFPVSFFNDWGSTNNTNVVTKIVIHNNTGAAVSNITAVCRWRTINGTATGQSVANIV